MLKKENVFEEVSNPTTEQVKKALMLHCFMIEKRDGRIKTRAVADGRSQFYTEDETYSPMVELESIMLNAFIDVHEGRHFATVDIKGAFLKAKVPEHLELIVKMNGNLAEMMNKLCPEFKIHSDGFMYMKCVKALNRHVEAARLFYDDLNHSLTNTMGFVRNRYDPCVYNKCTEQRQVTIRTHVDDLKISSRTEDQLNMTIDELRSIYQQITVHEEKSHDYLGMIMMHDVKNQSIRIDMKKYKADVLMN